MDNQEKNARGRRIKHMMVVFTLLLLICFAGMAAFHVTNEIVVLTMSKQVARSAGANHAAASISQIASEPSSDSALPSMPDSSESSSAQSDKQELQSSPQAAVSSAPTTNHPDYQEMYPNLYAEKKQLVPQKSGKVVYLTFDDGPSNLTLPLLDVLDRYKVKATFFLVGKTDAQNIKAMKAIVDRGHAIGVHSYTHQYRQIYANPAAFLNDFAKMHDLIQNVTGVNTDIYRYAGGSVNGYNKSTARAIVNEMNRRGYVYYDWNVSSGDAELGATARSIYSDTIRGVHGHASSVILFHNTVAKGDTLSQMPKIIETLQKQGYRFDTLDSSVDNRPYIFRIPA